MSDKLAATFHGADVVTRLRLYGPESDYENVMSEAADTIERMRTVRLIETAEQLDALPVGTVVLSQVYTKGEEYPCSFQRLYNGDWHRGGRSRDTHPDYFLPAVVLYGGPSDV